MTVSDFKYLQAQTLYHLHGNPVDVLGYTHGQKVLPDIQKQSLLFQFAPTASSPADEKNLASSSLYRPFNLPQVDTILPLDPTFSAPCQNSPSSLCFFTYLKCSSLLFILVILHWTCSSTLMPYTSRGFSAKLISIQSFLSLYLSMVLFFPRHRALHLCLLNSMRFLFSFILLKTNYSGITLWRNTTKRSKLSESLNFLEFKVLWPFEVA